MTGEFAKHKRDVIRAMALWAALLLFIDFVSFKALYHEHPKYTPFRLNGILMRTDGDRVEVFNVKSGKWTSYSKMLEEVKK